MKIFERDDNRGLEGVTKGGSPTWLPLRTTADVFVGEGNEICVVLEGSWASPWKLKDGTRVDLFNVHRTGELRWDEAPFTLSPSGFLAVKHFKLEPAELTAEEWSDILKQHQVKIGAITELGIEMLKEAAAACDGYASFSFPVNERSPKSWEMHDLRCMGLVIAGCSSTMDGKVRQSFKILKKGRTLLKEGQA